MYGQIIFHLVLLDLVLRKYLVLSGALCLIYCRVLIVPGPSSII